MNRKMLYLIAIMLLIAIVYPVVGIPQENRSLEKDILGSNNHGQTGSDDWWPMFRHDSANTGSTSSIAPNTNQLSWKEVIPDEIFSASPVIVDDKLYISTGWYYGMLEQPNETTSLFDNPSLPDIINALTSNRDEYFGGVYCLDADDGTQLWDYPLFAPNDPAVVDGKVYVTDLNLYSYYSSLYCLNAETGDNIWDEPVGALVTSPTIVADDKIFLGCLDLPGYYGSVKCYDLDGNILWSYPLPPNELIWFSSPAYYDGKVYFITSDAYSYYQGDLYCVNAENGEYIWSKPIFSLFFWFGSSSPVCNNGKVFAVDFNIYSYTGYLKCFDAENGNPLWQYPLGSSLSFATPAVTQDSAFVTSFDLYSYSSWLYRIYTENGTLVWRVPVPGFTYWFTSSSPVCSANKVFVCPTEFYWYSNTLYCMKIEDGSILWNYELDYETLASPSIADERVYTADFAGNIYAFEDELKIGEISGGLLSIKAEVNNIGESDFTDVSWSIAVYGGIFERIDRYSEGTIPTLPAGESEIVRCFPIFGLGNVEIEVAVGMPGLTTIRKRTDGFVLGPFILINS